MSNDRYGSIYVSGTFQPESDAYLFSQSALKQTFKVCLTLNLMGRKKPHSGIVVLTCAPYYIQMFN